jgi:ribosomal protein S18 acetylase RimI-like enzyme
MCHVRLLATLEPVEPLLVEIRGHRPGLHRLVARGALTTGFEELGIALVQAGEHRRQVGEAGGAWRDGIGCGRSARESGSFSCRNAVVIEHEGQCAGCLIGYEIPDDPPPIAADMPAMFIPLQQLEKMAPSTWYVNVLAVLPQFRNRGYGTELLRLADETGRALAKRGMSVIVSDGNLGARRLYDRQGLPRNGSATDDQERLEQCGFELGAAETKAL